MGEGGHDSWRNPSGGVGGVVYPRAAGQEMPLSGIKALKAMM